MKANEALAISKTGTIYLHGIAARVNAGNGILQYTIGVYVPLEGCLSNKWQSNIQFEKCEACKIKENLNVDYVSGSIGKAIGFLLEKQCTCNK